MVLNLMNTNKLWKITYRNPYKPDITFWFVISAINREHAEILFEDTNTDEIVWDIVNTEELQ